MVLETLSFIIARNCDIAEVCSIIVNDFVMIKVEHNNKIENVHIDNIEFI